MPISLSILNSYVIRGATTGGLTSWCQDTIVILIPSTKERSASPANVPIGPTEFTYGYVYYLLTRTVYRVSYF